MLSLTELGLRVVAGSLTTLSPCVFPLLPLVLAGKDAPGADEGQAARGSAIILGTADSGRPCARLGLKKRFPSK